MNDIAAFLLMIIQATETPIPPTITLTPTPTLPYCEVTVVPTYDPLVPVITLGMDEISTATPEITETIVPTATETPSVAWVGRGRYYPGDVVKFEKGINSDWVVRTFHSDEVCGRVYSIVGASSYYTVNGVGGTYNSQVRYYGGDAVKYWSVGYYNVNHGIFPSVTSLKAMVSPLMNADRYPYQITVGMAEAVNLESGYDKFTYGCVGSGKPTGWSCSFQDIRFYCLNSEIPTEVPTPMQVSTPTPNCIIYEDPMAESDPAAVMGSALVSQTCYQLFPGVEYDPDALPNGAKEILTLLGITIPIVDIPSVSVCLDSYSMELVLLGIDILPFITSCISLLAIGSLINEFRS